jgi:hypothetical protein
LRFLALGQVSEEGTRDFFNTLFPLPARTHALDRSPFHSPPFDVVTQVAPYKH